MTGALQLTIRTGAPLVLGLLCGALVIRVMGADPWLFYLDVLRFGLLGDGWQHTLTAMAPLLLIGLGLIIAFRAQLWNLGGAGTYALAAAVVAGFAPHLLAGMPYGIALGLLLGLAIAVGALLGLVPAVLKARRGTNEIVTSLMVSFIALGLANILVKGPLGDPTVSVPQTRVLELELMLPYLPGTSVHIGLALALIAAVVLHLVLTRTAFGLKIDMLGANPRAAAHAGVEVNRMTVVVFLLSGALIALAAAVDMLGLWGYMRTGWNPGYSDKILPFVFLARLNPLGAVPLVAFYAVLSTGGTIAAQRAGMAADVLLVIVALILLFMTIIEVLGRRRQLGRSYLAGVLTRGSR